MSGELEKVMANKRTESDVVSEQKREVALVADHSIIKLFIFITSWRHWQLHLDDSNQRWRHEVEAG